MQCVVSTVLLARVAFVLLFHSIADKLKRLCNKPFVFVQLEKYAPSWASTAVTPDVATEENSEDSQFRASLAKVCLPSLCRSGAVSFLLCWVPASGPQRTHYARQEDVPDPVSVACCVGQARLSVSSFYCCTPPAFLVSAGTRSLEWLPSSSVTRTL